MRKVKQIIKFIILLPLPVIVVVVYYILVLIVAFGIGVYETYKKLTYKVEDFIETKILKWRKAK